MFDFLREVGSMRNSKEILVLIVLIIVVLVATARADESISFMTEPEELNLEQETPALIVVMPKDQSTFKGKETSLELGVISSSSLTNDPDDYGLVLTISKSF